MDHKGIQMKVVTTADLNCNENLPTASDNGDPARQRSIQTETSFMQDSTDFQWCSDETKKYSEESTLPAGVKSYDETHSNYDDISKNIDANLAQIDIDNFCSEDITSILSLPTVGGESYSSATDNTLNTTESCSSTGKMETATHSLSEGSLENSLYKTKPLFSPVKESEMRLGTISTDSLDFFPLDQQDLNFSCQAQKNNYMIVFQGSISQLSDDFTNKMNKYATSIGKLKVQSEMDLVKFYKLLMADKTLNQIKNRRNRRCVSLPILPIQQNCHVSTTGEYNILPHKYLYTNKNVSISEKTESSKSHLVSRSSNKLTDSGVMSSDKNENEIFDIAKGKRNAKLGNIRTENNNNNACEYSGNNNSLLAGTNEAENSLYFEDSLMEGAILKVKFAYTSPIKEEETFEVSSGDETIKSSKNFTESCDKKDEISLEYLNKSHTVSSGQKHANAAVSTCESMFNNYIPKMSVQNFFAQKMFSVEEHMSQATQTKSDKDPGSEDIFKCISGGACFNANSSDCDFVCSCPKNTVCNCNKFDKKKSNVFTRTQDNCTQIPLYCRNTASQTTFTESPWKTFEHDIHESYAYGSFSSSVMRHDEVSDTKKKIYVCYPNYSLPDLSFLNSLPNSKGVVMKPLPREPLYSGAASSRRRARSTEGRSRPTSFNDQKACLFNPIEDWPSLHVLLPDPVKNAVSRNKMYVPSASTLDVLHSISQPKVSMSSFPNEQKSEILQKRSPTKPDKPVFSKRWSLQEPLLQSKGVTNEASEMFHVHSFHHSSRFHNAGNLRSASLNVRTNSNVQENLSSAARCSSISKSPYQEHSSVHKKTCHSKRIDLPKNEENFDVVSKKSDYGNWPIEFSVSPDEVSLCSDNSITTKEEQIWKYLVDTKFYILKNLNESAVRLHRTFYDPAGGHVEKQRDEVVAEFLDSIYSVLKDGIKSSLETPEAPGYIFNAILEFLREVSDDAECPNRLQQLMRESIYNSHSIGSLAMIHDFFTSLLRLRCVDFWFQHVLTCVKTIRSYYMSTSLLYLLTFPLALQLKRKILDDLFLITVLDIQLSSFTINKYFRIQNIKGMSSQRETENRNQCCVFPSKVKSSASCNSISTTRPSIPLDLTGQVVRPSAHSSAGIIDENVIMRARSHICDAIGNIDEDPKSVVFNNATKGDMSKVQQLRQQWEKFAVAKDEYLSKGKLTTPTKFDTKVCAKNEWSESNMPALVHNVSSQKCSGSSQKSDREKSHEANRRRSMIPIHKNTKTGSGIRRSGSAPSEKS